MMADLPKADAQRLPDVVPSARSLADKVLSLATGLAALEREQLVGLEPFSAALGPLSLETVAAGRSCPMVRPSTSMPS